MSLNICLNYYLRVPVNDTGGFPFVQYQILSNTLALGNIICPEWLSPDKKVILKWKFEIVVNNSEASNLRLKRKFF